MTHAKYEYDSTDWTDSFTEAEMSLNNKSMKGTSFETHHYFLVLLTFTQTYPAVQAVDPAEDHHIIRHGC